jgi:hypothetical protein
MTDRKRRQGMPLVCAENSDSDILVMHVHSTNSIGSACIGIENRRMVRFDGSIASTACNLRA